MPRERIEKVHGPNICEKSKEGFPNTLCLEFPVFSGEDSAMQRDFWRKCRIVSRWIRRAALGALLAAICAVIWFDRVGLPDFLQRRLVEALHERGLELEFSKLRLSLSRGLVADNVRVGHGQSPDSPTLSAQQVELEINYHAAWHGRLEVAGLVVRNANFNFQLSPTNALTLTNIQTDLELETNEVWSLNNFQAGLDGVQLELSGKLAHAREAADWPLFRGRKTPNTQALREQLEQFCKTLRRIHFTSASLLSIQLDGDARDIHSIEARLFAEAPAVWTPWGYAREFRLTAQLTAATNALTKGGTSLGFWTNALPYHLDWTSRLALWRSPRLDARNLSYMGHWNAPFLAVTSFSGSVGGGQLSASAELNVATRELMFTNSSDFDWHEVEDFVPVEARRRLADFSWRQPPSLRLGGSIVLPSWTHPDTNWLAAVQPTARLNGELAVTNAAFRGAPIDFVAGRFSYSNLTWRVSDLMFAQSRTRLQAEGRGDDRNYAGKIHGEFDLQTLRAFLPPADAARLFHVFSATEPVQASVEIRGNLKDWESLYATGHLAWGDFAVRGQRVDTVAGDFSYSNLTWRVSDVTFAQSRTRLQAEGRGDDRDYAGKIHGEFDLQTLRAFLPPADAARLFHVFSATEPAQASVEICGNLKDWESLYATGHLAWGDFAVRGQQVDTIAGDFSYTNQVVEFFHPHLRRGREIMRADTITVDLNAKLVRFENGYSTADPQAVAIAIGPKTAEIMAPYHFLEAPTALVNGCAPLGDVEGRKDIDLRFDVVGGAPFETHKFRATRLTGTVHWLGQDLILTNLAAQLYGGSGTGYADFDFSVPHAGADYHFWTVVTNVDFSMLAADVISPTGHLAGVLSGAVVVTHGSTEDWRAAAGYGRAQLRNGLLWDIPIFGFFSTALNQVSPGLGNLRATDAEGNFTMTNGVIHSDSLQINMAATRLQYAGQVDLKQNVNARVTALLLHNIWGVGPVISTVFFPVTRLFEYQVTGTLSDPKYKPVYILSRLLLMPLHPFRTLEGILTSGDDTQTNAPPESNSTPGKPK
ncbi:MAG TPA: hypothetical protein VMH30_10520 [Verrucomicrobiae bacterium]|nr:hypothetical protein [Verrucomicrobiae bacterium]